MIGRPSSAAIGSVGVYVPTFDLYSCCHCTHKGRGREGKRCHVSYLLLVSDRIESFIHSFKTYIDWNILQFLNAMVVLTKMLR